MFLGSSIFDRWKSLNFLQQKIWKYIKSKNKNNIKKIKVISIG